MSTADYHRAAENFELFYNLSKDKTEWVSEDDGKTYFFQSCTHLMRIYTTIAEEMKQGKDLQTYLMFLKKAYDMAKEGDDDTISLLIIPFIFFQIILSFLGPCCNCFKLFEH